MIKIVKIGGRLIEEETVLNSLCDKLAVCCPSGVLVHGGGSMAGRLASRLGMEVRMIDGRRVTDRQTLEVAVMAYAGWANKKIVATLQSRGINACGLSGCDLGVILAHKRFSGEIDWGYVGDIDAVKSESLRMLLDAHVMPVISPITFDCRGQLLNTNADSVAAAVAIALSRICDTELVFCLDKPGVLVDVSDDSSVIPVLNEETYREYLEKGWIHSGMIPKLENAFKTLKAGVKAVRLTDPQHLEQGTLIYQEK